jgi:hypothetical protein
MSKQKEKGNDNEERKPLIKYPDLHLIPLPKKPPDMMDINYLGSFFETFYERYTEVKEKSITVGTEKSMVKYYCNKDGEIEKIQQVLTNGKNGRKNYYTLAGKRNIKKVVKKNSHVRSDKDKIEEEKRGDIDNG